jgi:HK97 family phage prohead protease
MRKITKLFTTQAKSINDETKTIRFKISDDQTDRMGEIVDQASWDFKHYMNNPLVLWGHNPDEPENVLGRTLSVETEGGATFAEMQFDDDINPKAALVWKQLLRGTLRTVSVGFISKDSDGNILKNNELLEISVVPIPANPRAIALSYKEGSLSRKDASYLQESMKRELEFIEEQLKDVDEDAMETKDVEEVKTQIAAVLDAVGKLGEEVGGLKATVATLSEAKAEAEAKAPVEEDTAKDGENDQSGAADELDLETELTPELEAQIEAELAGIAS